MPFRSKAQWRAAFGGHIPGISKEKARQWAHETRKPFNKLPQKVAARHHYVRHVLRHADELDRYVKPDLGKAYYEHQSKEKRAARILEAFVKLAFAIPKPGVTSFKPKHVGSFKGVATNNFLKPPGPAASSSVINPRRNLGAAISGTR